MEGGRQWELETVVTDRTRHPPSTPTSTHPISRCGHHPRVPKNIERALSMSYCVDMSVVIPQDGAASKCPAAATVAVATEPQPRSSQDQPGPEQQRPGAPPRQPSSTQRQPSAGHPAPSAQQPQASSREHQSTSQPLPSASQQDSTPSSDDPTLIEGWLLAVEAKRQEMELQVQAVQQQLHRDWLFRQAPPTGNLPAATPLSYVGTPLEAEVPAGHPELPQQQHLEQPVAQGPVRNRFRKSPSRGALDVGSECEAVSDIGGDRT